MPDPFGTITSSIQAAIAQRANNKAALEQQRAQDMLARLMMQQGLISNRMQQGPAMMNAKRLQAKGIASQGQDKAMVNYVMSLNPSKVEPQWRYSLSAIQKSIKSLPDPGMGIDIAKAWTSKYRPAGLQFKTMQTMGTDADGNPIPITSLVAVDPMTASAGPVGGGVSGMGGGAPAAAPKRSSAAGGGGLSPSASALAAKYGLGGGP